MLRKCDNYKCCKAQYEYDDGIDVPKMTVDVEPYPRTLVLHELWVCSSKCLKKAIDQRVKEAYDAWRG